MRTKNPFHSIKYGLELASWNIAWYRKYFNHYRLKCSVHHAPFYEAFSLQSFSTVPCEIKKIKKWGHCTPKCHVFDRSKKLFFLPYKVVKKRKLHLTPDRFKRSQKSGTRPDRSRGQFLIQTCGNLGVFSLLMEKGCLDCFTIDIQ